MEKIKHATLIIIKNPKRALQILSRRIFRISKKDGKRYSTSNEVLALQKYAKRAKIGIVEIGVLDGGTTREMALVCSVPIFGIDPLIPDSIDNKLIGHEELIRKNLSFYKLFTFIKDYSFNVVKSFNSPFDFIWIDGDHSYEGCRKDFDDWFPLLSTGGYVAFHDSAKDQGYAGPIKVAEELKNDSRLIYTETIDSITLFKKK